MQSALSGFDLKLRKGNGIGLSVIETVQSLVHVRDLCTGNLIKERNHAGILIAQNLGRNNMKNKDVFSRIKDRIENEIKKTKSIHEQKGLDKALDIFEEEEAALKKELFTAIRKAGKGLK